MMRAVRIVDPTMRRSLAGLDEDDAGQASAVNDLAKYQHAETERWDVECECDEEESREYVVPGASGTGSSVRVLGDSYKELWGR